MEKQIATIEYNGLKTKFVISNPRDYIQNIQRSGVFYEQVQLASHKNLIYRGCVVLDIGANVGNHTMFYCMHTPAIRVFPFEPNPVACSLLEQNIIENGADARIDLRYITLAVGSKDASYDIAFSRQDNLGATALRLSTGGTAEVRIKGVKLDDLDFGGPVGFVKIDVEGMEIDILRGAERLFSQERPHIAVEVDAQNETLFWRWTDCMSYQVIAVFHTYPHNRNYVAVPRR